MPATLNVLDVGKIDRDCFKSSIRSPVLVVLSRVTSPSIGQCVMPDFMLLIFNVDL